MQEVGITPLVKKEERPFLGSLLLQRVLAYNLNVQVCLLEVFSLHLLAVLGHKCVGVFWLFLFFFVFVFLAVMYIFHIRIYIVLALPCN